MAKKQDRPGRRDIYLSERFRSWLNFESEIIPANFISLSKNGMAVAVRPGKDKIDFTLGSHVDLKVSLSSKTTFAFRATIRNNKKFVSGGQSYIRLGLETSHEIFAKDSFKSKTDKDLFLLDGKINPICTGKSALFFNENIIFNIVGFTASGILVEPIGHKKFLLPNLPIDLKITIPGAKPHKIKAKVTSTIVEKPLEGVSSAFYLSFTEANPSLLQDVGAFILTMTSMQEPPKITDGGFPLPYLDAHLDFDYGKVDLAFKDRHDFRNSPIAMECAGLIEGKKNRGIHILLNQKIIAGASVNFITQKDFNQSVLFNIGGKMDSKEATQNFVEIYNLFFDPSIPINCFFVPLLRHCIRIAMESGSKYLIIVCENSAKLVLEKVGFRQFHQYSFDNMLLNGMKLVLNPAIHNHLSSDIDLPVWNHIFGDLQLHLIDRGVILRREENKNGLRPAHFRKIS